MSAPAPATTTALVAPVPGLSREEAEAIRMGKGDPEIARTWLARAARIKAPAPPAEGALVANETGWLVARGDVHARLWPTFARWAAGSSAAAALTFGLLRRLLRYAPLYAIGIFGLGIAVAYGLRHLLTQRRLARWRDGAHALGGASAPAEATVVRITGRIIAQPTVETLFRGVPAVLFRNKVGDADETRGIDFVVALADGTEILVDVREAILLEPATKITTPPVCGPVRALDTRKGDTYLASELISGSSWWARLDSLKEASVGPGDLVEVIGEVEPPADGPAPPRMVVFGTDEVPLQVRKIPA